VTHPVRGIKGSDLLGFDSTAVKNRIKGKNTAIEQNINKLSTRFEDKMIILHQQTLCISRVVDLHPRTISQICPTRCAILFNIFIYFSSLHVSAIHVPIIRRKLLYLCDTGICHSERR